MNAFIGIIIFEFKSLLSFQTTFHLLNSILIHVVLSNQLKILCRDVFVKHA